MPIPMGSDTETSLVKEGPLIALRPRSELRAECSMLEVYIAKVPAKAANKFLNLLREPGGTNLQHLRRVAKLEDLPPYLRSWHQQASPSSESSDMLLLVGPAETIEPSKLMGYLSEVMPGNDIGGSPIRTIAVPLQPPTSQEQALSWSLSKWPTIYRNTNPFGPHPSLVSRAEAEIANNLDTWIAMATQVAARSRLEGIGEAIGAVIVDRYSVPPCAVALAGDGRWGRQRRNGVGNVMAHSVLRAIGMVAQKLSQYDAREETSPYSSDASTREIFLSSPQLPEEQAVFDASHVSPNGYLCHNLEIYVTHEPCVMCSMAIIHSRFGKVIFVQRMPETGGLCGEDYVYDPSNGRTRPGHGLFWRPELNWCLLAWETKGKPPLTISPTIHA